MSFTLAAAIAFSLGAVFTVVRRSGRPWWLLPLALLAGAVINWLRFLDLVRF